MAESWWLRLLFVCVDIYTISSFLLTSSLVQGLYTETAVFIDLFNGLYDFTPRSPTDNRILSEFQEAKTLWSRDTLFVGYHDARHNDLGTARHCYRLGVDIGAYNVVKYNHDGRVRRVIKKFHGPLPASCRGYTVPAGDSYDSPRRVTHVNDARLVMGQSYLHCTDPSLWGAHCTIRIQSSRKTPPSSSSRSRT